MIKAVIFDMVGVDYAEEAKDFPWRFWLEKEQ